MNNEVKLKFENLTKYYGKQKALSDISFEIGSGEIVGLVGPNGAGKTTLMGVIVGLLKHYQGTVYINGEDIKKQKRLNKKLIGCIIERPGLYPDLSGYENLVYFSKVFGNIKKFEIDEVIEIMNLTKVMHKKTKQYSMGMKQRLGIAQALLGGPELLILDEPTNGLDPELIPEIREIIRYYAKEKGITTLISSHILSEIEIMCDHAIILKDGKIIEDVPLGKQTNENSYIIETVEIVKMKQFLEINGYEVKTIGKDKLYIMMDEKESSQCLTKLIKSGFTIKGIYPYKESLETKFLRTIGGK